MGREEKIGKWEKGKRKARRRKSGEDKSEKEA